ncbi:MULTISPECIES: DUF3331 domain-containing protein [unclassified Burkholderia]|uniref:DUF3331 domain-containing protein n=1 Tax=unclassified Burkholderia TaxID=2613784 RepID=UPI000F56C5F3|nr:MULTISPECIES: DUF3331 domain-containing protein [unclassified Burkholderia]RQR40048.1 DUF3331 domain-containing protein [Burkholderia sp. Bp9131]RQR68325.1 DUF3331 domain-containing protein [Burkholderia sp. Bp9015]RQR96449.1 DUF3331 domain-containing protein [Burkholderia sp. Bp8994]RQS25818.1 DUF3331 domain-containing protein [Burkholderia sp. Bp8995]RQS44283.1 DUF3331 domain-containing protein [Burkholderia sp. Bp8989]
MPNVIECLICEYVSYHMLVAEERDAMPLPADVGMARPQERADRAPTPEPVAPGVSPLRPQLFVSVLEAGDDGLLVRWSESGRCHYGEQRWRLRVALQAGRCAISGQAIEPGEPVYRPVRRPVPVNGDEMIHPASVPPAAGAACRAAPGRGEATDPVDTPG